MCCIAGGGDAEQVAQMLDTMKHRAPDGVKTVTRNGYTIGMGRLAVIDLISDDLFPFQDEHHLLTFNGEIYNYIEIREELEALGHSFHTNSDIEVLLESYKEWGSDCVHHFNGMFAFALFDTYKHKIILARDIAGQKPLYYRLRDGLVFASEAKALGYNCHELPPGYIAEITLRENGK